MREFQNEYETYMKQVVDSFIAMQTELTTQEPLNNIMTQMLVVEWNGGLDWKGSIIENMLYDGNLMDENRKNNAKIAKEYLASNSITYGEWCNKYKPKYKIIEYVDGVEKNIFESKRSFNELELLAEELECVNMLLDDMKIPTDDRCSNKFSTIGRIKFLLSENEKQTQKITKKLNLAISIFEKIKNRNLCSIAGDDLIDEFLLNNHG